MHHRAVPKATILSELEEIPEDLDSHYVLKPLFSFAGSGVLVEPKPEDVRRIPPSRREGWCPQEKIQYEPALQSAEGAGVKVEFRLMFLRPDDQECLLLAQNLCRLSRGSMLGVDFNKSFSWVGASVGLWPSQSQIV